MSSFSMRPFLVFWLAGLTCPAMQLRFDQFVSSEILHHFANQNNLESLIYQGRPITIGQRAVVMGELETSGVDGVGSYVDLKGAPWIGRPHGVVRCYLASRNELDKLQSAKYVSQSLDRRRPVPSVAVEGQLGGLNKYGNFVVSGVRILDWASATIPKMKELGLPPGKPNSTSESISQGGIQNGRCLKYAPAKVSLIGKLISKDFPGPPNYESVAKGDQRENVWLLILGKSICTDESDENSAEESVSQLQLLFPTGRTSGDFRQFLNRGVQVDGWLFHSSTGHHRTPVMLQLDAMKAVASPAPQTK